MAREKKESTREERLRKEERRLGGLQPPNFALRGKTRTVESKIRAPRLRIAKVLKNIPVGKRAAVEKLIREMAYMGPKVGRPPAAQFCPLGKTRTAELKIRAPRRADRRCEAGYR